MAEYGLRACGYPQKETVGADATSGLIAITADTDIIPILKAQEVAAGKISATDSFVIKSFSIRVGAQAWFSVNSGTEFGLHPEDGFFSFDRQLVSQLVIKNSVNFKIAYSY